MNTNINRYIYEKDLLHNPTQGSQIEWLLTNGLGGFASTSIIGLNTRRYHGLLVAALNPPVNRKVLVNKFEEQLLLGDTVYECGINQYPDTFHPTGNQLLTQFEFQYYPIYRYQINTLQFEKSIWMGTEKNTTYVCYEVSPTNQPVKLLIRPFLNFRDYHSLQKQWNASVYEIDIQPDHIQLKFDSYQYHIQWSTGQFVQNAFWVHNIEYAVEQKRGLDYAEDAQSIGYIETLLTPGIPLIIKISAEPTIDAQSHIIHQALSEKNQLITRKTNLIENTHIPEPFQRLILSTDDFVVNRQHNHSKSIIAGYPWFTDWGRDTMISLPGLTLVTNRHQDAKKILQTFSSVVDQGMIPNRFPDNNTKPEYNTADGTLWFFIAVYKYYQKTKDLEFIRDIYPQLESIITHHYNGTRYAIKVERNGLLYAGEEDSQLTWMDAKIGDCVITPRLGMPVEINALWINAIHIFYYLSELLYVNPTVAHTPNQLTETFNQVFWNAESNYLYDVVDHSSKDPAIRPNQIFAIGLPFPLLNHHRGIQVLECIETHLLTPYGLRTLNPSEADYRPAYKGNLFERDGAYHQGTVWPWLLSYYLMAYHHLHSIEETQEKTHQTVSALLDHLQHTGIGHISEVFDADPPHRPGGCPAQAWSVATLIEAIDTIFAHEKTPSLKETVI